MPQSDVNPGSTDDEEDDKDHSAQRAFFAGVFKERESGGLGYTNAFRGIPLGKHGGQVNVKAEDTLGAEDLCWCGRPQGHSWPGKPKKPHPRGDEMSAMADDRPYLNPRDLRAFDRKVVRALCALVNEHGVEYRLSKGTAIILIAPHSTGQDLEERLRVSAQRKPEDSLRFIEKWAIRYVRPAKVEEAAATLAERFNDPTKKPHPKKEEGDAVSQSAPESEKAAVAPEKSAPVQESAEPEIAPEAEDIAASGAVPDPPPGYRQHVDHDGNQTVWWIKGSGRTATYVCKHDGYTHQGWGFPHARVHSSTPEERAEQSRVAGMRRDNEAAGRRDRARRAIQFLASEYDIPLATGRDATKVTRLEKRITQLEKQIEEIRTERDNLQARLDLFKEALEA
jgi:hypothetical protein